MKTVNRMIMMGLVVSSIMLNPIFSMEKNDETESKKPKLSMFQQLRGAASNLRISASATTQAFTAEIKARIIACAVTTHAKAKDLAQNAAALAQRMQANVEANTDNLTDDIEVATEKAQDVAKEKAAVIAKTAQEIVQNEHVKNIVKATGEGALTGGGLGAAAMGIRGVPSVVHKKLLPGFIASGAAVGFAYGLWQETVPEVQKMLDAATKPSSTVTSSSAADVQPSSSSSSSSVANATDVSGIDLAERDGDGFTAEQRESFKTVLDGYRKTYQEVAQPITLTNENRTELKKTIETLNMLLGLYPLFSQENNVESLRQQFEKLLAEDNDNQEQRQEIILPVASGISDALEALMPIEEPQLQPASAAAEVQAIQPNASSSSSSHIVVSAPVAMVDEQQAAAPVVDKSSNAMVDDQQPQPATKKSTRKRRNEVELLRNGTPETNTLNTLDEERTTRSQNKKAKTSKPDTTTH